MPTGSDATSTRHWIRVPNRAPLGERRHRGAGPWDETTVDVVERGLLDTSVVIALDRVAIAQLPAEQAVSALTLAELVAGPHATDDADERARRQDRLQRIEATMDALPFDDRAARAYGQVYAATRAHQRKPRGARAVDLLIAAVAVANGLPIYTANPDDFTNLDSIGLEVHAVATGGPHDTEVRNGEIDGADGHDDSGTETSQR